MVVFGQNMKLTSFFSRSSSCRPTVEVWSLGEKSDVCVHPPNFVSNEVDRDKQLDSSKVWNYEEQME